MSLITIGEGHTAPCFFCGQKIESETPAIARAGHAIEKVKGKEVPPHARPVMFLHPTCATELMVRLGLEVYQAEKVTGRKVTDPQMAEVVIKGLEAPAPKGTGGE